MSNLPQMELPKYECHKQVWALKIKELFINDEGSRYFIPEDSRYGRVELPLDYLDKHKPYEGGYYVVYAGGYKSFSPADAFESGYKLVN